MARTAPGTHSRQRQRRNVVAYDVSLNLTTGSDSFSSSTTVRFRCPGQELTVVDLKAVSVEGATLNGNPLNIEDAHRDGQLNIPAAAGDNVLTVHARFPYTQTDSGLYRIEDPDIGAVCVYSKTYPSGAARLFGCFDRRDTLAPFTLSVRAPAGWTCLTNTPAVSRPGHAAAGWWRFAPTPPLATCAISVCAGQYTRLSLAEHDGEGRQVPLTAYACEATADRVRDRLPPALPRAAVAYYEHTLKTPYPHAKCDLVFVPVYPPLATAVPGLITIKDQVLATANTDSSIAMVIAHELAHSWIGGAVDLPHPDDAWLVEALTTYLARTALPHLLPGSDPWRDSAALPDHAYARNARKIQILESVIGRDKVFAGITTMLRRHDHGHAGAADLIKYWSTAAGEDLRPWAADVLAPPPEPNT